MTAFDDLFERYVHPMSPIPAGISPSGHLRRPLKAILFDVYGTLFISGAGDIALTRSSPRKRPSIEALVRTFGISTPPDQLTDAYYHTIERRQALKRKAGIDFPEVNIEQVWMEVLRCKDAGFIRRFALAFELTVNPIYPMPHINDLFKTARASGLKLGIISNAQFYTPLLFDYFCGRRPEHMGFAEPLLIYSFQHERAKPSIGLFEMAVDRLASESIEPGAALFIGNDMLNDIYPARAVGFQTALFAGDRRSLRMRKTDPRCRNLKPDIVVTTLLELVPRLFQATP